MMDNTFSHQRFPSDRDHWNEEMPNRRLFWITLLFAALLTGPLAEAADIVVHRGQDPQRDGGKITKVTKTSVTVSKQVGGDVTIPSNEIAYIEWDGAPASMRLGRTQLAGGQFDLAIKNLEEAAQAASSAEQTGLQSDIDFLLTTAHARKAISDPTVRPQALEKLETFIRKNKDHYRYYDAQLLLGEVAVLAGNYAKASSAYSDVAQAPWKDYQMAAQVGKGRSLLAQNDLAGAKKEFDAVAMMSPQTDSEKKERLKAMLGQARCLQLQQQYQQAADILEKVIDESSAQDSRLQAEAYLRQGDCFLAKGDDVKKAIMAYLHVDVIPAFSREKDLHAEALYQLARLWNQVSQPQRAAEAAEALRGEYPESPWAKKLGG